MSCQSGMDAVTVLFCVDSLAKSTCILLTDMAKFLMVASSEDDCSVAFRMRPHRPIPSEQSQLNKTSFVITFLSYATPKGYNGNKAGEGMGD